MTLSPQELAKEHQALLTLFAEHPVIKISAGEGDPPREYFVEYLINGLHCLEGEKPEIATLHKVSIMVPSDYPESAPLCKALTPNFHPDIDPAAISISEFWHGHKSLVELVLYIGQKIAGQQFSDGEAFNPEAAEWYEQHKDRLPLDNLDLSAPGLAGDSLDDWAMDSVPSADEAPSLPDIDLDLEVTETSGEVDLGGPEEITLDLELETPADEKKQSVDTPPQPAAGNEEIDLQLEGFELDLKLENQDEPAAPESMQGASEEISLELESTPDQAAEQSSEQPSPAPPEAGLDLQMETAPPQEDKAGKMDAEPQLAMQDSQADEKEQGEAQPEIKLELDSQAEAGATPPPPPQAPQGMEGLQLELDQTSKDAAGKKAAEDAGTVEPPQSLSEPEVEPQKAPPPKPEVPGPEARKTDSPPDKKKKPATKKLDFKERIYRQLENISGRLALIVVGSAVGVVALAVGVLFVLDLKNYNQAANLWAKNDQLLANQEYKKVSNQGEAALKLLGQVRFFKGSDSQHLKTAIRDVLNSRNFKAELAGMILYEGVYISNAKFQALEQLKVLREKAEKAAERGDWQGAVGHYDEVMAIIAKNDLPLGEKLQTQLKGALGDANIELFMKSAEQEQQAKRFTEAVSLLERALALAQNTEGFKDEKRQLIRQKLELVKADQLIKQGEAAFAAGNFDQALEYFKQALKAIQSADSSETSRKNVVEGLISKVQLSQIVEQGKAAFEASRWQEAETYFAKALHYMDQAGVKAGDYQTHRERISKMVALAGIQVKRQEAKALLAAKNYPEALATNQQILELIDDSSVADSAELISIRRETRQIIAELVQQQDINRKLDYLIENFENIFKENNMLARTAILHSPEATFLYEEGDSMVFLLKCKGQSSSGRLSFELKYQYNTQSKSWEFYSKK